MNGEFFFPSLGSTAGSILVYALLSGFVTGPLIAERTIARSGWLENCAKLLKAEITQSQPETPAIPKLDCNAVMGLFGEQGKAVCRKHGNWQVPFLDQLNDIQEQKQAINRKRMEFAVSNTTSRCSCASAVMIEQNRMSWGIHAGSIRFVTPPSINNLEAGLMGALQSSWCQGGGS